MFNGSKAWAAGLSAGDTLLAMDGLRVNQQSFTDIIRRHRVGDRVSVSVFRRDELINFTMELAAIRPDTAELSVHPLRADCLKSWLDTTR